MTERIKAKRGGGPRADRPRMPGYGLPRSREGLLPWSWAQERLTRAHNYFVCTARPDGAPHAMPVWGVWLDDVFYFSTGRRSRKARNLSADPRCVVCAENATEAVIVEGRAAEVQPAAVPARARRAYQAKYDFALDPSLGPVFAVRPRKVFGLIEHADQFYKSATRWRFEKSRAKNG